MDSHRIGQHTITFDKQNGILNLSINGSVMHLRAHEAQDLLQWLYERRNLLQARVCRDCGKHASTFCQYCEQPICSACRDELGLCKDCRSLSARETFAIPGSPSGTHDDLEEARAVADELCRQRIAHYIEVGKELIERKERLGVLEFHKSIVTSAQYSYAFACVIMQLTKRFQGTGLTVNNVSRDDLREIREMLWYMESHDNEQILREAKGIAAFDAMYDER
jgi:hypothetical protein